MNLFPVGGGSGPGQSRVRNSVHAGRDERDHKTGTRGMTKMAEATWEMGTAHVKEEEPHGRVGGDWPATRKRACLIMATSWPDDLRRPVDRVRSAANPAYEIRGRPSTIEVSGQNRVRLGARGGRKGRTSDLPLAIPPRRGVHNSTQAAPLLGSRAGQESAGRRRVRPHCSIVSSLSSFSLFPLLPSRLRATEATSIQFGSARRSTPSRCH
jgi:hypothetical protein